MQEMGSLMRLNFLELLADEKHIIMLSNGFRLRKNEFFKHAEKLWKCGNNITLAGCARSIIHAELGLLHGSFTPAASCTKACLVPASQVLRVDHFTVSNNTVIHQMVGGKP